MEDAAGGRYWCHFCSQIVTPDMEFDLKCPYCQSGFVEEMSSDSNNTPRDDAPESDPAASDRALSLWAPILLGMMDSPRRRRRMRPHDSEDDDAADVDHDHMRQRVHGRIIRGDTDLDRELETIIRRRRRRSATILQLLQGVRSGIASDQENTSERDGDGELGRERERVVLINPFNQTVVLQGLFNGQNQNGSLGDYMIGPNLDLLLQHLAENDPNRYGTPPAKKEAVGAMPTVKVKDNLQCSVCLDEFEIGEDAKEMPCKHKFHPECILPWLELHSSCPVCRYQLPANESKPNLDGSTANTRRDINNPSSSSGDEEDLEGRTGSGRRFSIPWPFTGLFPSQTSGRTSSSSNNPHGNGGL